MKRKKVITYKSAGVDIQKAEEFVKGISFALKKNKTLADFSAFACLFDLSKILKKYKNPVLVSSTDGVGTKLKIAQALNIHNTVGIDLVAMNVNDIICCGAKPLFFLDYIACGKLKPKLLSEILQGINKGLSQAQAVLLGGETAEMPGMYKPGEYDLAGFCIGIVDKDKIVSGKKLKAGDTILGLVSSGIHSNGYSLVRKVLGNKDIKKYGKTLLTPTKIYTKEILSLLNSPIGRYVHAISHNTGGAFYNKLTKVLPEGLGFVFDSKKWPVPEIFSLLQEKSGVNKKQMYSVFNMGIGMIVAVDNKYAEKARRFLSKYSKVFVIGEVIKSKTKAVVL